MRSVATQLKVGYCHLYARFIFRDFLKDDFKKDFLDLPSLENKNVLVWRRKKIIPDRSENIGKATDSLKRWGPKIRIVVWLTCSYETQG